MEMQKVQGFILAFLLIGVMLGIGITVIDKLGTSVRVETAVTNENRTVLLNSPMTFTNDYVTTTSVSFKNASSGTAISSAFFSFDKTGKFQASTYTLLVAGVGYNNTKVNVSYTYGDSGAATDAITESSNAIGDFAGWLGIIVVIIAAALIISLVITSFNRQR